MQFSYAEILDVNIPQIAKNTSNPKSKTTESISTSSNPKPATKKSTTTVIFNLYLRNTYIY